MNQTLRFGSLKFHFEPALAHRRRLVRWYSLTGNFSLPWRQSIILPVCLFNTNLAMPVTKKSEHRCFNSQQKSNSCTVFIRLWSVGERQVTKPKCSAESLCQYPFKVIISLEGWQLFNWHLILLLKRKPFLHAQPPPERLVIESHFVLPNHPWQLRAHYPSTLLSKSGVEEKFPVGNVNSQQLCLAWPAELQPAPWPNPRTDKALAKLLLSPAFVSKMEGLLLSVLMAPPCSVGLSACLGQEESEGNWACLSSKCPAKAGRCSSDTHQIWAGLNCLGSRPALLLLLPQPRGQSDLHAEFSLVSLTAWQGKRGQRLLGGAAPPHEPQGRPTLYSLQGMQHWPEGCRKVHPLGLFKIISFQPLFLECFAAFLQRGQMAGSWRCKTATKNKMIHTEGLCKNPAGSSRY